MVIYQSMIINLERFDLTNIELLLNKEKTTLETSGKRGNIRLAFTLVSDGETIGHGEKHMVLSGLRPFEQDVVDSLVAHLARDLGSQITVVRRIRHLEVETGIHRRHPALRSPPIRNHEAVPAPLGAQQVR